MGTGGMGDFGDGGGVDTRVLAYVEGLQVKAVGADFEQEWIDEHAGEAAATVANEAGAKHAEIADEVGGADVWLERGLRGQWNGEMRAPAETHHDAAHEQAGGFVGETILERGLAGGSELLQVAVEQEREFRRDGDEAGGTGELVEDVLQATAVVME